MLRVDILSLFPGMFQGVFSESIPRIAQDKGALSVHIHNIRDWTTDKHGKVDDRPFGGGPGMVMACQPIVDAVQAVRALDSSPARLVFFTPEGRRFDQSVAKEYAEGTDRFIFVCGRYEGFDERIFSVLEPERVSIGDFILSGGEIAAMVVVDALARLLPGVLGCPESVEYESFSGELLDHPHYTQPPVFQGLAVPEVLRGGNHAHIDRWRQEQAKLKTLLFRPDLIKE